VGNVSTNNKDANKIAGVVPFNSLIRKPYAELGYGVENILKFIRIDLIHRLTYFNNPNTRPIGLKVSAQFKL
jgi:hypothetical protein